MRSRAAGDRRALPEPVGAVTRPRRRDDAGLTIIEVLVAIALLALIMTPIIRLVIQTGSAANNDRLTVEATDIATSELEQLQNTSTFGTLPTGNVPQPSVTLSVGGTKQTFHVSADYALVADQSGSTVCSLSNGTPVPPEVERIVVTVAWLTPNGSVAGQVKEGTYIAPEEGGAIPETSGEVAVPVQTSAANGTPFTSTPVPFQIQGTWSESPPADNVPGNQTISENGNTGATGCAVFPDLDPDGGYEYTATLETSSGSVFTGAITSQELPGLVNSGVPTDLTPFSESLGTIKYGQTVVAPAISLDLGTNVPVTFFTQGFSSGASAITPAADIAVTVSASELTGSANHTFAFDTLTSGVSPQTISSVTLYPYTDYECWAGDTPDAAPTYAVAGVGVYSSPANQPVPLALPTAGASLSLPVYPLVIKTAGPATGYTIDAVEANSPNHTLALNAITSGSTSTGLPLGQYDLTVTGHTVSPQWIWVTDKGVYTEAAFSSGGPTGTLTAPGSPITVTVT